MKLTELNAPLEATDIDFRPAQVNQYGDNVYCSLLAYKDARVDMHILDTVCGQENWTNEYKRDSKGVLQCGIGIWMDDRKNYVWKWSNGTPSDFESEKGEYSDAFKRAGFMWGIGRCLYEFPPVKVILNEKEIVERNGKPAPSGYFKPNSWDWLLDWEHPETGGFVLVAYQTQRDGKKLQRFHSNPNMAKNPRHY